MNSPAGPKAAIVDYGLGNLFSVSRACAVTGMNPLITRDRAEIIGADAVILPGVGAFGDAMKMLHQLDLAGPIRDLAAAGKPLIGICLGMQLLMSESFEFAVMPDWISSRSGDPIRRPGSIRTTLQGAPGGLEQHPAPARAPGR